MRMRGMGANSRVIVEATGPGNGFTFPGPEISTVSAPGLLRGTGEGLAFRDARRDQMLRGNVLHRQRLDQPFLLGDGGLDFLLDLVEPIVLHTGDGLRLEEGGYVEVRAAEEDLVEVKGRDAASFVRIAWHLGNRHLPAQIAADRILIRDDHVIIDMLRGLGAEVRRVKAPFDPEGGAYGQHNHDLGHRHGPLHSERHGD